MALHTLRPSPRLWRRIGAALLILIALALLVQTLGPVDPYHQAVARSMQEELAKLEPYRGSTLIQTTLRAALLDINSSLEVNYSSSGPCSAIQSYYALQTKTLGWAQVHPITVLHHDSNPDHDALDASYQKEVNGFSLGLTVECFLDQSYQGGYYLSLNIPPAGANE